MSDVDSVGVPRDRPWNPSIWWFRWLVLWRDVAHANVPRVGGACDHRRCAARQHPLGCRSFRLTPEQAAQLRALKDAGLPVGVSA